jgi:hypothetical protein
MPGLPHFCKISIAEGLSIPSSKPTPLKMDILSVLEFPTNVGDV